jgi:PQQ-dependent catabolism-associated CXXCW motif protein
VWRIRSVVVAAVLALWVSVPMSSVADDAQFDPVTRFRISQYRAPTPQSVPGGITITLEDLQRLTQGSNAVLIDVMPSEGVGPDPVTGVWHVPKPRDHMSGSIWLPDVGKGSLTPALDAYFQANLARSTGHEKSRAIIIYCQADCWMSWNAVKRAASYGYTILYWYPDGTDGMRDWDVPLVRATPVPLVPPPKD